MKVERCALGERSQLTGVREITQTGQRIVPLSWSAGRRIIDTGNGQFIETDLMIGFIGKVKRGEVLYVEGPNVESGHYTVINFKNSMSGATVAMLVQGVA